MNKEEKTSSDFHDISLIGIIVSLIVIFLIWANSTNLDLVTRGGGRVIAVGENKSVQASEKGVISSFLVRKGQPVIKDQVIAKINPIEAEGTLEEVAARIETLKAKLARIDGELNGVNLEDLKQNLSIFPVAIAKAQLDLFNARKAELNTIVGGLKKKKSKVEKDVYILKYEAGGLTKLRDLLSLEISEVVPLVEEGIIGKSEKFRLERESTKLNTDLRVIKEKQIQINLEVEKLESELQSVYKKNNKELYQNRSEVIGEIVQLNSRIPVLSQKLTETEIRSPIDGVVNRVFFNNKGAVLREGDIVAEIVPIGSGLQIEAFIDPKDIGFIEPGQKAKVSLTAYDASKYGYIRGTLKQIAADTVFREETKSYQYSTIISIENNLLDSENKKVDIYPGMVAQVDIIRGNRTILEYFWQPIAKIKDTAFKE